MTTRIHPPASPPPDSDDEQLRCGRMLFEVWSDWEDGVVDSCPHCERAVQDLDQLGTAVRQMEDATDEAEVSSGFDPAALTQRVMDVVRLELRPGRPLPLSDPADHMWIMESVAARTLRTAAEQVPGVRAGSCRIDPATASGTGKVTVRIGIRAPWSTPDLQELADRVRSRVEQAADRRLGLDIGGVDICITDLDDAPVGDEASAGDDVGADHAPSGDDAPACQDASATTEKGREG
ncbi:Asp23/Gls24 family envelope stress response protein [Streptomyces longhuiensis]|uniref:Asp23/Gls24 family envelope stress response protein n=1 Tax=Streptomyces longhuiensis TaxID=2880933 RepID=UPI001D0A1C14|nr:Asp23/Gls24 family envelope stress response protein [Streptomyces longhuiensis]UDM05487.1 Asp23/Gls24 family envelope stress response protein [Streptomyces longhuiensis]